ncbi:Cilia BBSome complex subunit 10 [Cinara cedri]|uniref:Cilia BBSome complex subunit 10 n=1 Tax=Cinara cedri TaxID=506608 RepID=A0A5E4MMR4_9HEMI|nr:Cilia BBSome complex subunit 10 [Cinara cedri]
MFVYGLRSTYYFGCLCEIIILLRFVGMQNDKSSSELPAKNISPVIENPVSIKHFVPKIGLLHHKESTQMILCKPKLMPLKSVTLEKLQKMQSEAEKKLSNR